MTLTIKTIIAIILVISPAFAFSQTQPTRADSLANKKPSAETFIKFDDTQDVHWSKEFEVAEIRSSSDKQIQKAYFYKTKSNVPMPLVVSLHTWSGDYSQKDDLAEICRQKELNYIHPDFRGVNKTTSACGSELALTDIDDAIGFAIKNGNVDTSRIYVLGVSGGGYATLSTFMKSKHRIKKFSAWASITDLAAWYHESTILKNKYAQDILACTDSKDSLNGENAKKRSPLYMPTPTQKLKNAQLFIFAGIYDGIQGSVPIAHSINFYNKLLKDLAVKEKSKYVSDQEKLELLEHRRPLGKLGTITDRKICLQKEYGNLRLTLFEGGHEMLSEYALNEILKD